jgi:hypothetical protein
LTFSSLQPYFNFGTACYFLNHSIKLFWKGWYKLYSFVWLNTSVSGFCKVWKITLFKWETAFKCTCTNFLHVSKWYSLKWVTTCKWPFWYYFDFVHSYSPQCVAVGKTLRCKCCYILTVHKWQCTTCIERWLPYYFNRYWSYSVEIESPVKCWILDFF